jgi:hypothetical protein
MHKQQIVPILSHNPWPIRHSPWSVRGQPQQAMHEEDFISRLNVNRSIRDSMRAEDY